MPESNVWSVRQLIQLQAKLVNKNGGMQKQKTNNNKKGLPQKVHNMEIAEYLQHAVEPPKQPMHHTLCEVNPYWTPALPTSPGLNPI